LFIDKQNDNRHLRSQLTHRSSSISDHAFQSSNIFKKQFKLGCFFLQN